MATQTGSSTVIMYAVLTVLSQPLVLGFYREVSCSFSFTLSPSLSFLPCPFPLYLAHADKNSSGEKHVDGRPALEASLMSYYHFMAFYLGRHAGRIQIASYEVELGVAVSWYWG